MRFKLEENLPVEATQLLRAAGHDASSVVDERLQGATDGTLDRVCRHEGRILVTLDLDFSDIRAYLPAESPGRIVLRVSSQEKRRLLAVLEKLCVAVEAAPPRLVYGSWKTSGFGSASRLDWRASTVDTVSLEELNAGPTGRFGCAPCCCPKVLPP